MLVFVYSYKGYTITDSHDGKYQITFPNDIEPSVYTLSLDKAHKFIDEMEEN